MPLMTIRKRHFDLSKLVVFLGLIRWENLIAGDPGDEFP